MLKRFIVVVCVVILLAIGGFVAYWELVRPDDFAVFVESIQHGTITVDGYEKTGTDDSFRVVVPNGDSITLSISPEVTDSTYYELERLLVNGEDVTSSVTMLKYTTSVKSKLSILAYFAKADRPKDTQTASKLTMPSLKVKDANDENKYLGSVGAYGLEDPSIIYDGASGYYYCFASGNKVSRSKDFVNWESIGTYFKPMTDDTNDESIMDFSGIKSVYNWSLEHGYSKELSVSDENNSRVPTEPELIKMKNVYYLYFTVRKSSELNESAIFCVKTDNLEDAILTHTWEDVGLIINTCCAEDEDGKITYDAACACSPSAFAAKDGRAYLSYGAYYGKDGDMNGSVRLLELDTSSGKLKKSSAVNVQGDQVGMLHGDSYFTSGALIAKPGRVPSLSKKENSQISGADISYYSETNFYYMFLTYGTRNANENIRVLRSENPDGPYTDYTGNAADGSTKRTDQLDIGLKLLGGYTFTSSNLDGVTRNDLGRASMGSPSIVKLDSGWLLGMHSSAYVYSDDGTVSIGGENGTEPALDIRKIVWTDDGWPLLNCEPYAGEKLQKVSETEMYGIWDVVVTNKRACEDDINAVENNKSFKTTIFAGVAITENNVSKGTKLSSLKFEYADKYSYRIVLDSVEYTVYAITAYDSELGTTCLCFTGVSEDGNTVFAKKSVSTNSGLYTDVYDYALDQAGKKLAATYKKKFEAMSDKPSQIEINTLASSLVAEILAK